MAWGGVRLMLEKHFSFERRKTFEITFQQKGEKAYDQMVTPD